VLNALLAETAGKPLDIATAYFTVSGYRLLKDGLHRLGGFRLLLGAEPQSGVDLGLRLDERKVLLSRLRGDLEASPFTPTTLKLIEDLIAFLRTDRVEVRLYDRGFLHAKAYLFHQDAIGPNNRYDRSRDDTALVMTNATLRKRFAIADENYPIASRIIADTIEAGLIKPFDPDSKSRKHARYVPFWT
jgi:hypothetical protein